MLHVTTRRETADAAHEGRFSDAAALSSISGASEGDSAVVQDPTGLLYADGSAPATGPAVVRHTGTGWEVVLEVSAPTTGVNVPTRHQLIRRPITDGDIHNNGPVLDLGAPSTADPGWSAPGAHDAVYSGSPRYVVAIVHLPVTDAGASNYWALPEVEIRRNGTEVGRTSAVLMQENAFYSGNSTLSAYVVDDQPGTNPAYTFTLSDSDNRTATAAADAAAHVALIAHEEADDARAGTAFPTGGLYDGRPFFRTDLRLDCYYDAAGSRWLGELEAEGYGDSGGLNNNQYFRRFNGMGTGPDRGVGFPYDVVIQEHGVNWETPNTNTGNIEIEVGGSVIHSLPTTGDGPANALGLNIAVPAGSILAFRRDGGNISNTQGYVRFRRVVV